MCFSVIYSPRWHSGKAVRGKAEYNAGSCKIKQTTQYFILFKRQ